MGLYRVIIGGATPAPGEVWSVGMALDGPDPTMPQADINQWATNIGVAIAALVSHPLINLLSSAGNVNFVRCEQRHEATEALLRAGEYQLPTPKPGSGTASKVLQNSLVISLRTLTPGRSYRGRVYWPAWAYTGTAEQLFASSSLNSWLPAYADLVELVVAQAIAVDPSYAMILVVRSRLLHVSTPVTALAVGNVPDTQRRRRDALTELYTVLAV